MEFNSYEFASEKKIKGTLKLRAVLLVFLYVVYVLVTFFLITVFKVVPLGALIPITLWILVLCSWRFVKIDNKYIVESGVMCLKRRYGNSKPKKLTEFHVKDAIAIAPLDEKGREEIAAFKPEKSFDALPYSECERGYYALYTDETGKRCALCFMATDEALKILSFYNGKTVR